MYRQPIIYEGYMVSKKVFVRNLQGHRMDQIWQPIISVKTQDLRMHSILRERVIADFHRVHGNFA